MIELLPGEFVFVLKGAIHRLEELMAVELVLFGVASEDKLAEEGDDVDGAVVAVSGLEALQEGGGVRLLLSFHPIYHSIHHPPFH